MASHILRHFLINTDWQIVLLDSFKHRGKTDRIHVQMKDQDSSRVSVVVHDLRAPISPQMIYRIGHVDYVVNTASESHVDRSIESPRDFIENNVQLMLTMLDYARFCSVKKFIQVSTDEVYGPASRGYSHKEGEPHKPSNPYSASKAAQEDICYAYWRTFKVPIILTNTMNIVGELQDPEKFVPMIIRKVLAGEEVTIHASSKGEVGTRHYLHARNQADALLFLLDKVTPVEYGRGGMSRFNVVGEMEIDNLTLAEVVADFVGKPLKYKFQDFHSSRPGHDLRYSLDGSKLAKMGWRAPYDLEESLEKTVEWTLKHREWL
jgi:dTDP-glucose 4,6-dehydratase